MDLLSFFIGYIWLDLVCSWCYLFFDYGCNYRFCPTESSNSYAFPYSSGSVSTVTINTESLVPLKTGYWFVTQDSTFYSSPYPVCIQLLFVMSKGKRKTEVREERERERTKEIDRKEIGREEIERGER